VRVPQMSESEFVDEDYWFDMDDPYEEDVEADYRRWEREGLPTNQQREGGAVNRPSPELVHRNVPQRRNTCIFVVCGPAKSSNLHGFAGRDCRSGSDYRGRNSFPARGPCQARRSRN
jgi:hypothetical protein